MGAVAFSHWLLDLLVHRADLPMLPGNAGQFPRMGLGLWRMPAVTVAMELALVAGGAYLYWRAAIETASSHGGRRSVRLAHICGALVLGAGLLTLTLNLLGA
jgi:hypothetical protein